MKITANVKTHGPARVRADYTIPGVTALHLTEDGLVVDYDNGLRQDKFPLNIVVSVTATGAGQ